MCAFRKYFINADNLSILIKTKEMTHIMSLLVCGCFTAGPGAFGGIRL